MQDSNKLLLLLLLLLLIPFPTRSLVATEVQVQCAVYVSPLAKGESTQARDHGYQLPSPHLLHEDKPRAQPCPGVEKVDPGKL